MNFVWAIAVPIEHAARAAILRLRLDVEVCEDNQTFWVRGHAIDETLDRLLRQIGGERFVLASDSVIHRPHSRIARGRLPAINWKPIAKYFPVHAPPAAMPGTATSRAAVLVIRSNREIQPGAIVTTMTAWAAYACSAAAIRVDPLKFAQSRDGRALIIGSPLPPIPGTRCTNREGILVPCGFELSPALEPVVLHRVLELDDQDLALFASDGTWERIPAANVVPASRSAVRLSLQPVPP